MISSKVRSTLSFDPDALVDPISTRLLKIFCQYEMEERWRWPPCTPPVTPLLWPLHKNKCQSFQRFKMIDLELMGSLIWNSLSCLSQRLKCWDVFNLIFNPHGFVDILTTLDNPRANKSLSIQESSHQKNVRRGVDKFTGNITRGMAMTFHRSKVLFASRFFLIEYSLPSPLF